MRGEGEPAWQLNDAGYSLSVEHGDELGHQPVVDERALRLEATNALYPSSDGGATVSCVEINR